MTATTATKIDSKTGMDAVPALDVCADLPSEADRRATLLEIMGQAPANADAVPSAIRAVVDRTYDRSVVPLIEKHWPATLPGGDEAATGAKLRFLACSLYGSAPYTVLFCAENRPFIFRAGTRAASLPVAPTALLPAGAKWALSMFSRFGDTQAQRRIVLIGAFIATIDHAFDHTMDDVAPKERSRRVRGLLEGTYVPDDDDKGAPLRLTRALQLAMCEGISDADRQVFDQAMARVVEWCESEVLGLTGVPDPKGLSHRLAGVEGTIDGLVFPVHRHAGESVRRWMYDVSWFVQMMDDWLDVEKDIVDKRETPVITGAWNEQSLRRKWDDTVAGLEALALAAGPSGGKRKDAFVAMVRDAYVSMMHDVRRAMSDGIAA